MTASVLRQLVLMLGNIVGVIVLCFLFHQFLEHQQQLPWWQSLWQFVRAIVSGELGTTQDGAPIIQEFFRRLPATIELWISAIVLAFLIGIPAGVMAATQRLRWPDRVVEIFALIGFSLPVFWWALLLVLWFSLELEITPVSERIGFFYDIEPVTGFILIDSLLAHEKYGIEAFLNALLHLLLPVAVLAILPIALVTRVTKTYLVNVLSSDYIRMARGQGFSERRLVWKHGLANIAAPILQIFSLQLSSLFTGVFLIEAIFSWPGVSAWLLERVQVGDYDTVIMGGFLLASLLVVVNALMDSISTLADPRRRRAR